MKVAGFTFIKNAIIYDYPIVEAIQSILTICDEFIVAVGDCDDGTRELIEDIHPTKIKIIDTVWDNSLKDGGYVLADETNKAYKAISKDTDWAFYIQGDEVVHEKYLDTVYEAMVKYKDKHKVDGLLFNYNHFYASYDYIGTANYWYSNEIRVIKNNPEFYSYRDAQGFRKRDNQKLNVAPINAYIYHYGWVRPPLVMKDKLINSVKFYHTGKELEGKLKELDAFDYSTHTNTLVKFKETHPKVIKKRIRRINWQFDFDLSFKKKKIKNIIKDILKSIGIDTYYRNYNILKKKDLY